eukprot:CAMPEP_0184975124 /NCGR_PEP_ID=MMETSP1098-20130426/6447_1 /TAXON_ID=89044 /ORGANISM="Spumella elongata, Strain CCAP 955/1" /LENGTH=445 /DNA_ID=CAMNT_0027497815 /DNA_START=13 /DNA_END=1350 /DNA_ORIENTATION=-
MGDYNGESIGLLHSAGYKSGGNVHGHGHTDYNTMMNAEIGSEDVEKYSVEYFKQLYNQYATRENIVVALSVAVLIVATAVERITFKIMVDRMLPYKFVLVQIIFLFSAITFIALTKIKKYLQKDEEEEDMTEFPQATIFAMAVADTIPFLCMAFSASGVPPTMTVVLMHSSTIFVVLGSKVIFPERHYTQNNYIGVGLIATAIGFCLLKILVWKMDLISSSTSTIVLCCFAFLAATSLHGLSTLYKEKNIIEWSRPTDNMYLTSCLFIYQFIVTICIAVLVNIIRAIAGYDTFSALFSNVYAGWRCFLGFDSHLAEDDMYVDCSESMGVVLGYVICNAAVVVCMGTVLTLSHQILGRAIEAAILLAFLVLWGYDVHVNNRSLFGGNEGLLDLCAIIVLIAGMEVYDRDPEPDVQIITKGLDHGSSTAPGTESGDERDGSFSGTPL